MPKSNDIPLSELFGCNVFSDKVMQERLPEETYLALKKTIDECLPLDSKVAEEIAKAMKEWAIEKGATHYTHWFQPMTGVTAEKHDSFISSTKDGKAILEFSGKELIKGEPDASSFPSGGLRATFEARGYTTWDCTSPAFLKEDASGVTLCIPTAFCSYTGQALDKKTPLLRSMEVLSKHAVRVLKALGHKTVKRVITTVGAEQEYFLIDKKTYDKRKDLIFTGRTLFGARPPKGQEMDDHYYGSLKERIAKFMHEVDIELWKLGVTAKTKHNEVAPCQHELAPIYTTGNIATDHNQLMMETMKKVALRHGLVCLLHEKPFKGLNGSGKHNNWSLVTDDGINLLKPGKQPHNNLYFLVFLTAVIKAVDTYGELLIASAATEGNDLRLGGHEAPPTILSVFLGDYLFDLLTRIEKGETCNPEGRHYITTGVSTLASLKLDHTDRNRTSTFAFTGNKFEFRMVGSSSSIATSTYTLNTIVSDALCDIADKLEKSSNPIEEAWNIIRENMKNHKKIIYNGNCYCKEWHKQAEKRGLPNIKSAVDAFSCMIKEKNIFVFEKHGVLNKSETFSRYEINLEKYIKKINIEAITAADMAMKQILPACIKYATKLSESINSLRATGADIDVSPQLDLLKRISNLNSELYKRILHLEKCIDKVKITCNSNGNADVYNYELACYFRDVVIPAMDDVRDVADKLELLLASEYWPIPTYQDLLFFEN